MTNKKLSVIIPCHNESDSLEELRELLLVSIQNCQKQHLISDHEIIFIDDGSTDDTAAILHSVTKKDRNSHYIIFRRNFGKSIALQTGFRNSSGDIIVTIDADLQDDPAELANFLCKLDEGYDMVVGWKTDRQDSAEKRLPSKFFNAVTSWTSGLKLHDMDCGYKAFSREVADNLVLYGHLYRYIPVLAHHQGFKVTEIPVHHQKRKYGQSHYGFERYFQGFYDFLSIMYLTKFGDQPMYLFGTLGGICGLLGLIICVYMTFLWSRHQFIGSRPLLQLGILLIILGVQLFSIGFIGDMIANNNYKTGYNETHVREKNI